MVAVQQEVRGGDRGRRVGGGRLVPAGDDERLPGVAGRDVHAHGSLAVLVCGLLAVPLLRPKKKPPALFYVLFFSRLDFLQLLRPL